MQCATPYVLAGLSLLATLFGFILKAYKERIDRLERDIEKIEERQREHNDRIYEKLDQIEKSITGLRLEMATGYVSKEEAKSFEKRKGD